MPLCFGDGFWASGDGGEDGLDFYRRIAAESPRYLNGGGRLYLEIGCDQADAVQELLLRQGFREVNVAQDYAGLDRVVSGYWPIRVGRADAEL